MATLDQELEMLCTKSANAHRKLAIAWKPILSAQVQVVHGVRPSRKVTLDGHVPSHRALRLLRRGILLGAE